MKTKVKLDGKGYICFLLFSPFYCDYSKNLGKQMVTRGCALDAQKEECTKASGGGAASEICYCKGDKCNSSTNLKPLFQLAPLLFSIFYLII